MRLKGSHISSENKTKNIRKGLDRDVCKILGSTIGGAALDDSGVKTMQWRERKGHDSYQEVEVYIYMCVYVTNIPLEIVALLWSGAGNIHILAMCCDAVEIGGIGKGSSKPSLESGGLFRHDVG